jgi:signal transduction histidine kinase
MREITLHLLDIAENSVAAGAKNIDIYIEENLLKDRLYLSIEDDGKGMDEETVKAITDPFTTSRTERKVGLGIPLLKNAAEACEGSLTVTSALGKGTKIEATFQHSHIDRMPLGDVGHNIFTCYCPC